MNPKGLRAVHKKSTEMNAPSSPTVLDYKFIFMLKLTAEDFDLNIKLKMN